MRASRIGKDLQRGEGFQISSLARHGGELWRSVLDYASRDAIITESMIFSVGEHQRTSDGFQRSAARTFRVVIQIKSATQPMDATTLATGQADWPR